MDLSDIREWHTRFDITESEGIRICEIAENERQFIIAWSMSDFWKDEKNQQDGETS